MLARLFQSLRNFITYFETEILIAILDSKLTSEQSWEDLFASSFSTKWIAAWDGMTESLRQSFRPITFRSRWETEESNELAQYLSYSDGSEEECTYTKEVKVNIPSQSKSFLLIFWSTLELTMTELNHQKFKNERKGMKISLFGNILSSMAKNMQPVKKEDSELAEDGECKDYDEWLYKSNTESTKMQTYIPIINIPERMSPNFNTNIKPMLKKQRVLGHIGSSFIEWTEALKLYNVEDDFHNYDNDIDSHFNIIQH